MSSTTISIKLYIFLLKRYTSVMSIVDEEDKNPHGHGHKRAKTGHIEEQRRQNEAREAARLEAMTQLQHCMRNTMNTLDEIDNEVGDGNIVQNHEDYKSRFATFLLEFDKYRATTNPKLLRELCAECAVFERGATLFLQRIHERRVIINELYTKMKEVSDKIPSQFDMMHFEDIDRLNRQSGRLMRRWQNIATSLVREVLAGNHERVDREIKDFKQAVKSLQDELPGFIPRPPRKSRGTDSA